MNLFRSTTTLATDPKNRSPLRRALLLIPLVLACFGLSPVLQATDLGGDIGVFSTADGVGVLLSNTGHGNSGFGFNPLFNNTSGSFNTATGDEALVHNTTGSDNTADGAFALFDNTVGMWNTTNGFEALFHNTTGNSNTAVGAFALFGSNGKQNTANGVNALKNNTSGSFNTADGSSALFLNSTGSSNVGIGFNAGHSLTTGAGNVCIGVNVFGVAGESNTTRIRNIFGSVASGRAVYVNSDNKLGTLASSRRFKEEIKPMDKASETLLGLKPVTFRYKKEVDPTQALSFGLIAEEVAEVNPSLVTRDEEGKPQTVRYEAVNAMLLNEFLKEHRKNEEQGATIAELKKEIAGLTATVKEQAAQIQKVSAQVEVTQPAPQVANNNQ